MVVELVIIEVEVVVVVVDCIVVTVGLKEVEVPTGGVVTLTPNIPLAGELGNSRTATNETASTSPSTRLRCELFLFLN